MRSKTNTKRPELRGPSFRWCPTTVPESSPLEPRTRMEEARQQEQEQQQQGRKPSDDAETSWWLGEEMRVETIGRCDGDGDGGCDTAMQQLQRCRLSGPKKQTGAEDQPGFSCSIPRKKRRTRGPNYGPERAHGSFWENVVQKREPKRLSGSGGGPDVQGKPTRQTDNTKRTRRRMLSSACCLFEKTRDGNS